MNLNTSNQLNSWDNKLGKDLEAKIEHKSITSNLLQTTENPRWFYSISSAQDKSAEVKGESRDVFFEYDYAMAHGP